jgi:hypothetical protein
MHAYTLYCLYEIWRIWLMTSGGDLMAFYLPALLCVCV